MSIVENLGIKPIDRRNMWAGTFQKLMCDNEPVEKLEADYKEAIEAIETQTKLWEIMVRSYPDKFYKDKRYYKNIKIIEKAYGESWEDIRRDK